MSKYSDRFYEILFGNEKIEQNSLELQKKTAIHEVGHWLIAKSLNVNVTILAITIIKTSKHSGVNLIIFNSDFELTEDFFGKMLALYFAGENATSVLGYGMGNSSGDEDDAFELIKAYKEKLELETDLTIEEIRSRIYSIARSMNVLTRYILFECREMVEYLAECLLKRKILTNSEMQALYEGKICIEDLEPIEDL